MALVWLPTLLRVIALTGGSVKTPAGEASTSGFLEHFRELPPDDQERSLAAAAAVIDQAETTGSPTQREQARQVRIGLEDAIAEIPRTRADVARRLREVAHQYELLRQLPSGEDRTTQMTQLVSRARGLAAADPSAADPSRWFARGTEGSRIVALAAIQALPDAKDIPTVLEAIAHPKSAFEQWHALRASDALLPYLTGEQRRALAECIEGQLAEREGGGRWITPQDMSRYTYAQHLLRQLGGAGA